MPSSDGLKDFFLTRDSELADGFFGRFRDEEAAFLCYSLERKWLGNQSKISCIPTGRYLVELYNSPTKGLVYRLDPKMVEPRENIEIHSANLMIQLEGCIAPGLGMGEFDVEDGKIVATPTPNSVKMRGVTNSKDALRKLKLICGPKFWLNIGVSS